MCTGRYAWRVGKRRGGRSNGDGTGKPRPVLLRVNNHGIKRRVVAPDYSFTTASRVVIGAKTRATAPLVDVEQIRLFL